MEKDVFLQGLCCSSLIVETAAWPGCMRVEISGTALNCPLLVTGSCWPGFKMLAASVKPLSHLPWHWTGTDYGHLFIVILDSAGESPIQPSHREFEKGKEIKTG